jgi:hypothetical protein
MGKAMGNPFSAGQVVEFRPPVSGGVVIAVVTRVVNRTMVALRVTDGTATYPTGSFTTTSTGWVS